MESDADLMEASLLAVAEAGVEIRHALFARFFEAFPERRPDFFAPEATSIRMTDETLQMMLGLAKGENWVWPLVAELVHEHLSLGDPAAREYDAFIDMTIEELGKAAGAAWTADCADVWRRQGEALKALVHKAQKEWAAALPVGGVPSGASSS